MKEKPSNHTQSITRIVLIPVRMKTGSNRKTNRELWKLRERERERASGKTFYYD